MEKVNEVVSSNFAFFTMAGVVVLLCGIGIAALIDVVFQIPDEFRKIAKLATIIASLNVALSFSFEVFEGLLHALQKFVYFNLVKNLLLIVRVALTFVVLKYENGLLVLAGLLVGVTLLQAMLFYGFIRLRHPEIKIRRKYLKFDVFKVVVSYSAFILLFQLAGKLSFNTSSLVIGGVISVAAIVFFTISNNFILYFTQMVTGISRALMPRVSQLDALNDHRSLQEVYLHYSKLTSFIVVPACFGFIILGGDFISLWMGEKYRVVSGDVLSILTLSSLFLLVQRGVAYPILMGTSRLRFPTLLLAGTALVNLLLSVWWGWVWGLNGVAWGTTVPNLVNAAGLVWYTCRTLKISFWRYLYQEVLVPVYSGIFFAVPAFLFSRFSGINSYTTCCFAIATCSLTYVFFYFIFFTDNNCKQSIYKKLRYSFAS
jgi:O-antigen/teichoic acid export membrane protein